MGVTLRLKLFPIQLAEEIVSAAVFYGTLAPFVIYAITRKLFLEPYEEEKSRKEKEKLKTQYKERLKEKRAKAEAAINLMQETFRRIQAEERAKHGLVILEATYGVLDVSNERIDVTVPLQCLVKNSKLALPSGPKSQLPGFYDPAPGEEKKLKIKCLCSDVEMEKVSVDSDAVQIP